MKYFDDPMATAADVAAYDEACEAMQQELTPPDLLLLCQAIREHDEETLRARCAASTAGSTLMPKKEAVLAGESRFLRILLEHDSSLDEDIMLTACELKRRECIRIILDFGWPINQHFSSGGSALWFAIHDLEFMQWLIDNGADVSMRSVLDESTLSKAIAFGSIEVVDYLLSKEENFERSDLLHCAALRDNENEGAALVEKLSQRGADVNAHRYNNNTALRMRCKSELPTPLHIACKRQNIPVIRALMRQGADPYRQMLKAFQETPPTAFEIAAQSSCKVDLISILRHQVSD